jgi:hypothetical protein
MLCKWSPERMREKISQNCEFDRETGCINWTGAKSGGYGSVFNGLENMSAHRATYEAFIGEIHTLLKEVLVLHKCNNMSCVNTAHLYLGTRKENTYDALRDGCYSDRRYFQCEDIAFICYLYTKGITMRTIAKMYLSNHERISNVLQRQPYYKELLIEHNTTKKDKKDYYITAIQNLRERNFTRREIAERLDIGFDKVKKLIKEYTYA